MLRLFFQYKLRPHKTQVSTFFISLIATLVIITFITIMIGKTAKDKTYSSNAADAGALAAASVMAYAFNYVAEANRRNKDARFEKNYVDFMDDISGGETQTNGRGKFGPHFPHAYSQWDGEDDYAVHSDNAKNDSCCLPVAPEEAGFSDTKGVQPFIDTIKNLRDKVIPDYWDLQQKFIEEVRERVHDDTKTSDLYQNALYAGYIFNFYNSGISHRLGKINSKRYEAFLKSITPETVSNCEEKTFSWVDGAARYHTVTAIICIDPVHSYKMKESKWDRSQVKQGLTQAITQATAAKALVNAAKGLYTLGRALCWLGLCPPFEKAGDTLMQLADTLMQQAYQSALEVEENLKKGPENDRDSKSDTERYIIAYIQDINHPRTVTSSNFQFHMGGPVKGARGDVDFPTAYPPVQSQATASWDSGSIYPQQPSHDARLISVF